jgi:CPA2 family monovalent cation:H+ antiporter-2
MHESHALIDVLYLLAAAVVVVSLIQRLRISPIVGYLAAGLLIGPTGFGVVRDPEGVRALAEFGVVFLLFTIGLELSLQRLWTMRRYVLGLGSAQVVVTGLAIGLVAWVIGVPAPAAVIIGGGLALSSTAVTLQLLVERGEATGRFGRVTIAILLMQDIAVVPLLVLVPLLAGEVDSIAASLGFAAVKAAAVLAVIVVLGRLVLRPVLRAAAAGRDTDLFAAVTLLIALGTAFATAQVGLSLPLGAFLAGLLIAETEFRHQVEADIRNFRGLLLGLFFMTVGMSLDLDFIAQEWDAVIAPFVALLLGKIVLNTLLARLFGLPWSTAGRVGLALAEGGEFAFVLFSAALVVGIIDGTLAQLLLAVVVLTLATTPLLAILGARLEAKMGAQPEQAELAVEETGDLRDHVVIAGFGRVGQTVAKLLTSAGIGWVAVDRDVNQVAEARRHDLPVYFGDASRPAMLESLGIDRARAAVVTLDHVEAAERAVEAVQRAHPGLPVVARVRATCCTPGGSNRQVPARWSWRLSRRACSWPAKRCNRLMPTSRWWLRRSRRFARAIPCCSRNLRQNGATAKRRRCVIMYLPPAGAGRYLRSLPHGTEAPGTRHGPEQPLRQSPTDRAVDPARRRQAVPALWPWPVVPQLPQARRRLSALRRGLWRYAYRRCRAVADHPDRWPYRRAFDCYLRTQLPAADRNADRHLHTGDAVADAVAAATRQGRAARSDVGFASARNRGELVCACLPLRGEAADFRKISLGST